MYLIVVGAGAIGTSLVELALKAGHDVVLIEPDKTRAERVADAADALVLNAPITADDIMEEAGAEHADILIATTGDDSTNLMAMFLAQESGIRTLVSVVNQVHHRRLFERLRVHVLVDPEVIVARHLLNLALHPRAKDVAILGDQEQLFEVSVTKSSPLLGKSYSEIAARDDFPAETFMVAIEREQQTLRPAADVRLEAGDVLILFARRPLSEADLSLFTG
jgi:trk/ktr system potassium uptake protein